MTTNIFEKIASLEKRIGKASDVDASSKDDIISMKADIREIKLFLRETLEYTPRRIKHTR
jgi:hypothetical protein